MADLRAGDPDDAAGLASVEVEELPGEAPPVVAVMVTRDPGPWFEEALAALRGQHYPRLTIVVVDSGSREDPGPRVARACPEAHVRRTEPGAGFAAAVNDAVEAVEGATFLLMCHDDVVLDPDALTVLVEEAYRSNAAIVGPKLVDAADPEILLEVGLSIDRFGIPHSDIEPGEVDQEQHDAVRDVFYVSSAAMLVRADLLDELGGLDPATFPGAEDLDICWRARLAGARVVIVPDARARHHEAAAERSVRRIEAGAAGPDEQARARARVRVVLTSYSRPSLALVVPSGIVVAAAATAAAILTGHRGRSRFELGAWWWNLRRPRAIRVARRRAQAHRRIHDRDLRGLQAGGSAHVRRFLSHRLHTEDRLRSLGDAGREAVASVSSGARLPVTIVLSLLAVLLLVGSRELFLVRVPAVGSLLGWPEAGNLLDAYGSGWRYTGLGSSAPAPPAFVLMAGLSTVLLGAAGLARTLVVLGAFGLGALGAYRAARPIAGAGTPAAAATAVYACNPVPRNAIAGGRLGPLVCYALAPFLLVVGLRAAARRGRGGRGRIVLGLAVVTAVAGAFFPLAVLVVPAIGLAFLLASPVAGGFAGSARLLVVGVIAGVGGLVLLFPWPLTFLDGGTAALGLVLRPDLDLGEALRFESGPNGAGAAGYGALLAAVLGLGLATGARLAWAARAWAVMLAGFALAWLPGRIAPSARLPTPEGPLVLAALGLALAVGLTVAALVEELARFRFGWRQPAVVAAGLGLVFGGFGFAADALDGRWHAPSGDWQRTLGFLADEQVDGEFRVLWLGDPAGLPNDPAVSDAGIGWTVTRNGTGDARESWPGAPTPADELLGDAVDLVASGRTGRAGHLFAPTGVRYIAVPERPGPGAEVRTPPPPGLVAHLDEQIDLVRLGALPDVVLYENGAWAPARAVVEAGGDAVPTGDGGGLRRAVDTELDDALPLRGSRTAGPGVILWAEAYDRGWEARAGDETLDHRRAFGWTNAYELPDRRAVSLRYEGQASRWALLAVQATLWSAVIVVWWRGRARAGRRRVQGAPSAAAP